LRNTPNVLLMNKLWLLVPLALATAPVLAQSCVLTGTIKGIGAKPILFRYVQQGKLHRDTVRAVNDRFTYTAKPSDDGKIALIVSNPFQYFWHEPGKLTVTGDMAQPSQLAIVGTPENNLLNQFHHDIEWKFEQARKAQPTATDQLNEQEQLATRQFIKSHLGSRTAADALYQQSLFNEKPLAEYEQLLKQLTPAVRQSVQGQQAAKRLLVLRNQPTVGRPVPNFAVADTAGVTHSLATYRGKYVVLDFWGHWCSPCIKSMPKLQALQAQYADKLTVIGIAMEDASDVALWKQAIRKYGVPGVQLSELQQAKGPVISGYNVTAFPTYMLLDRQGGLLVRTDTFDDITKKLATLADL
jgi:thiol-disulfide isomerase/thioredoxin